MKSPKFNIRNVLLILGILVAILIGITSVVYDFESGDTKNKEFIEQVEGKDNSDNEINAHKPEHYIKKVKDIIKELIETP